MLKLLHWLLKAILPPVVMYDASDPTRDMPRDGKVIAGYIGGDTPHVWQPSQWRMFGKVKKLPIFVVSNPIQTHVVEDAFNCLMRLWYLGVPKGSPVVLDLEVAVNPTYVYGFYAIIHWAGYKLWPYGSLSTITQNPACDGRWVANYTGIPHEADVPGQKATQYKSGSPFDVSLLKYWDYRWILRRW